jgi:retron-type reverse transcriptase
MAMEPIWESDFHRSSYGFRPERSVHHAIRTVKFQLQDHQCSHIPAYPGTNRAMSARIRSNKDVPVIIAF